MGCPKIANQILWFLLWWFIAWPVGFFCSFFYILLNGFRACCPCLTGVIEFLHKGVNLTGRASEGVVGGDNLC